MEPMDFKAIKTNDKELLLLSEQILQAITKIKEKTSEEMAVSAMLFSCGIVMYLAGMPANQNKEMIFEIIKIGELIAAEKLKDLPVGAPN